MNTEQLPNVSMQVRLNNLIIQKVDTSRRRNNSEIYEIGHRAQDDDMGDALAYFFFGSCTYVYASC